MRFITRTLPWIVILVVIAFFIGLKQSSYRVVSSTASSVEKTVENQKTDASSTKEVPSILAPTEKASSTESTEAEKSSETSSATLENKSEESETPDAQPEAVIIIDGAVVTETPSESDSTDAMDVQLYEEGVVEEAVDAEDAMDSESTTTVSQTDADSDEEAIDAESSDSETEEDTEGAESSESTEEDPSSTSTTSWFDSPVLLSMNPPVLSKPIQDAKKDWNWSEMVGTVEEESLEDSSDDAPDSAVESSATESSATTAVEKSATDSLTEDTDTDSIDEQSSEDASKGKPSLKRLPPVDGPVKESVESTEESSGDSDEESVKTSTNSTGSTETASDQDADSKEAADEATQTSTSNTGSTEATSDQDADSDEAVEESEEESDQPAEKDSEPEATPRKPLSPDMQKFRDGVRQTINVYSKPLLNTRDNTVAQLLDVCEAFGCDAEVMYVDKKRKINAFANLCYNYPCAGYKPLKLSKGNVVPRLGYGFQSAPGEMLAVMALARVPETYALQFSENVTGTVADLVQREKETCHLGKDLSFKLIGISRYTPSDEEWKSADGQTWTVERLLEKVMKQPSRIGSVAGTNRLLAISYAIDRRIRNDKPLDGAYAKADKHIKDFQDYALTMMNDDGTWHPQFFYAKGKGRSNQGRLRSTGHILRWLVFSLPEEKLQDPRIVKAVWQVNRSLGGNAQYGLSSASSRTIDSRLTAVHALVLYNSRLFKPYDAIEEEVETIAKKAEEKKPEVK